uniref:Cytochrome P450 n=1 Tax=Parastrongyloides trichosuri TaxID=131310 RepID=A0A0N4Z5E6_PARTI
MLSLITTTIIIILIINFYKKVYSLPPGPFPLPLIGNLYLFNLKKMHLWIEDQKKKYGPVFTICVPKPFVVLGDVDAIKEAFVENGDNFIGRNTTGYPEKVFTKNVDAGVIFSEGDRWRDQRRLSISIMRDFGMGKGIMEEKIKLVISDMYSYIDSLKNMNTVDIPHIIQLTVGNVINGILFGFSYKYDDADNFFKFRDLVDQFFAMSNSLRFRLLILFPEIDNIPILNTFLTRPLTNITKKIHDLNRVNFEKCKKSYNPDDEPPNFVHALLKQFESKEIKTLNLDDDHLEGMVLDFFTAGMETTATTLKYFILYLINDTKIQDRLRSEIDHIVGKDGDIKLLHKNDMVLVSSFIHEAQRFAGILGFPLVRKCTNDTYIKGNLIKKGTLVIPFDRLANHDERYFEDPFTFKADRFVNKDGKGLNKNLLEKFVPFGIGKRICAGKSLAEAELFLILASLLQRYKFTPNGPVNMEVEFGSILSPKPYTCKIEKRN